MKRTNEPTAAHRFRLWLVVCLLLSAGPIYANESQAAQELLQRMMHAVRSTSYAGVCIYHSGDNLQAIRIIHQVKDGQRRERLISLNGPAREIIRNSTRAIYIEPTEHSITKTFHFLETSLNASFPAASVLPDRTDHLYEVYDLELLGMSRMAGRAVRRLHIVPHDHFRYGYRLWIGEDHGLLLRSDLIDTQGEPLEQMMFTAIEIPKTIPDQWLEPTLVGDKVIWHREHAPSATIRSSESAWEVGDLPEGFKRIFQERHSQSGSRGDGSVEHQLYSDGLATVSVYIRQAGDHPFNGWSRRGAVSAFGRTLEGYQIIVVGEVPPVTVQLIGESVHRVAGEP